MYIYSFFPVISLDLIFRRIAVSKGRHTFCVPARKIMAIYNLKCNVQVVSQSRQKWTLFNIPAKLLVRHIISSNI